MSGDSVTTMIMEIDEESTRTKASLSSGSGSLSSGSSDESEESSNTLTETEDPIQIKIRKPSPPPASSSSAASVLPRNVRESSPVFYLDPEDWSLRKSLHLGNKAPLTAGLPPNGGGGIGGSCLKRCGCGKLHHSESLQVLMEDSTTTLPTLNREDRVRSFSSSSAAAASGLPPSPFHRASSQPPRRRKINILCTRAAVMVRK